MYPPVMKIRKQRAGRSKLFFACVSAVLLFFLGTQYLFAYEAGSMPQPGPEVSRDESQTESQRIQPFDNADDANKSQKKDGASASNQNDEALPLKGPLSPSFSEKVEDEIDSGKKLIPHDTLPLGVEQYTGPKHAPDSRGAVGIFVGIVNNLTYNKPCINCTGVEVKITNHSLQVIIADGEHVKASAAGKELTAISEAELMKQSGGTFTRGQKGMLAAAGIFSLGLAEPILQDHFSTSKKDFPVSYGVNETRRRLEDLRFCKRIILPEESTQGVIFFAGDDLKLDKITIPILTYPEGQQRGTLEIPVSGNLAAAAGSRPNTAVPAAKMALPDTDAYSQEPARKKVKDRKEH